MEEILASIRRIIAEDGEGATAAAPPPARPAAAQEQPQPAHHEDILELTESVAEDGTVVSLTPGGMKKQPAPPEPPTAAPVEATAAPDAEAAEAPLEVAPAREEEPEPPPLRLRSAATVAKRLEPSIIEPPAPPAAAPRDEAPPAPEPPPPTRAAPRDETPPAPEPPQPTRAAPESAVEPAPPPIVGDRLISSATAAASVAALSQLADLGQTGQVGTTPLGEAGRTLESLVRELLKPMLRDWMDANLTPMVERLVREEIQRMARNAQGR